MTASHQVRPIIFVDCTYVAQHGLNTGIQRLVRNVLRNLPSAATAYGFDVMPVRLVEGRFVPADPARIFANKQREEAEQRGRGANADGKMGAAVLAFLRRLFERPSRERRVMPPIEVFRLPEGQADFSLDSDSSHETNILLLLDASWGYDPWDAVRRFKARGGYVATVVPDLTPISHPQFYLPSLLEEFSGWLRHVQQEVDCVAGISRFVRDEVEAYFRTQAAALPVLRRDASLAYFHLGSELDFVDPRRRPRPKIRTILSRPRTFIVIGSIEPRKNHTYILDAFDRLFAAGSDATLVIIGHNVWKAEGLLARLEAHPLHNKQLFLLRDILDEELDFAYRHASALIIASLVEGFGLPIVESWQRGLPVLCSDIPVFREIAEGHALFFGLDDPAHLAAAVQQFLRDGAEQSPQPRRWMTWQDSAQMLLDAIIAARHGQKSGAAPARVER